MSNQILSDPKLIQFKDAAIASFNSSSMPTAKDRPWRYTDVSKINLDEIKLSSLNQEINISNFDDSGIIISKFSELTETKNIDLVSKYLGKTKTINKDKFSLANDAYWNEGLLIYASKNQFTKNVVNIEISSENTFMLPRVLIIAEENSEIQIQITLSSKSSTNISIPSFEVFGNKASRIKLFLVSKHENTTHEYSTIRSEIDQDANFEIGLLPLNGKVFKQTVENSLTGSGSNASINGFALGNEDQHFDFVTIQDHIGKKSTSKVDIKSALGGNSRNIYYGITRVEESAHDAQAEQSNRNLLLSSTAKADSDPVLEILTSHVIKCGHAATVGPMDKDALYYLQSRGLTTKESTKLLVSGSYSATFENMNLGNIHESFIEAINNKLELI